MLLASHGLTRREAEMHTRAAIFSGLAYLLLTTVLATAQGVQGEGTSPPSAEDHCVFADRIYSLGSRFCLGAEAVLVCHGPETKSEVEAFKMVAHWEKENEPAICKGAPAIDGK